VDIPDAKTFTWGDGHFGKLGHQTLDALYVPYAVTALQRCVIRMCALGKDHSLFLTNDGIVVACGSNGYGQLGIGQGQDGRSIPTLINGLNHVKSVSAGHCHSMAHNSTGSLYAWGSGSWGKLGLCSLTPTAPPRLISALKSVPTRSVACGGHHTVAKTVAISVAITVAVTVAGRTSGPGARSSAGGAPSDAELPPRAELRIYIYIFDYIYYIVGQGAPRAARPQLPQGGGRPARAQPLNLKLAQ
jgi:hypothetical protein